MRLQTSKIFFTLTLSACVAAGVAHADTIVGSGSLQTWSTSALANPNGTPYWNNVSWDGAQKNIGNCVSGVGNCGMSQAPGNLPYYGTSTGGAVTDIYLHSTGGAVSMELAGISNDHNQESYGWYDITDPTVHHSLYAANGATTTAYTPSTNYGLYFQDGSTVYYSQSSLAGGADTGNQHFVFFEQGSNYYVGMEDLAHATGDNDHNDLIVKLTTPASATPEPGSMTLLGGGMIAGAYLLKRRNKKQTV